MAGFPEYHDGVIYLTEGGQETEIMYRHGHDLPEFAMYPLLDNPAAMADLTLMYGQVLEIAERHGVNVMLSGLDYRASPDWAEKLGYSRGALATAIERSIGFLHEVAEPYRGRIDRILIGGMVGPRRDAYARARVDTAEEAEEYHFFQIDALSRLGVDFVHAVTFGNVAEAVGVSRAAARAGLPVAISFMPGGDQRLTSGMTLRQAIAAVDAQAGTARPDFYGINCSHPLEFEPALEPGDWVHRIRSLRPNASAKEKIELCQIGHLEEGDPVDLGERMGALARRFPHIDLWGGCCGTWATHLEEIARNVGPRAA